MKFAVIGLGYFGSALTIELAESGHEVIAIDINPGHLRKVQDLVAVAAEADGTDIEALRQLGLDEVDTAIVGIGTDFEASLMITSHCQTIGVKSVYTRVINEVHDRILDLMKISGKIRAESMAARYFARQLTHEAVRRYFELDSEHGIVEIEIPKRFVGMTLEETGLRKDHRLNVITIRRVVAEPGKELEEVEDELETDFAVLGTLSRETVIEERDRLIVFGELKDIERFCRQ